MLRVDENEDGVISYEEFAPLAYELILQRFKQSIYEEQKDSDGFLYITYSGTDSPPNMAGCCCIA